MQNDPPAHLVGKSTAYDYLKSAPDSAWAWEFARRNALLRAVLTEPARVEEVDDNLSGFLLRAKRDGRTVIGANKSHPKNRQRFTIAHELGHFLLHEGELVHLDEEMGSFTVDFRNAFSSKGEDINEKEANYFAAELLMPEKFLRQELRGKRLDLFDDGEELQKLARKYKVSTQALTFRLTNLGYIKA